MNREALVEQAVAAILTVYISEDQEPFRVDYEVANAILDAILPQITTVEELEALPVGTRLIGSAGETVQVHDGWARVDCAEWAGASTATNALHLFGPLTVVWRP